MSRLAIFLVRSSIFENSRNIGTLVLYAVASSLSLSVCLSSSALRSSISFRHAIRVLSGQTVFNAARAIFGGDVIP